MSAKTLRDILIIVIVALSVMGIYLYREWTCTNAQIGVPLDDAWIHYHFASNLVQGNGFVYNIGEPVSGSTSPFWVFLLAGVFFLSGEFLVTSKILSGFFFLCSGVGIYLFALEQGYKRNIAIPSALITIMAGRFGWASLAGMEVTLFAFVSIVAVIKHCRDKREGRKSLVTPVLFAIASLVRPEGYALFAFATMDNMVAITYSGSRSLMLRVGSVSLIQVLIYLAIIAPYLIFSYHTTGHLLPQTYYAQNELFGLLKRLEYLKVYVATLWDDQPLLFFFIPLGMGVFFQAAVKPATDKSPPNSLLVLLWTVGYPLLTMFVAPNARHHHRYMMPLIPFYMVFAMSGINLCLRVSEDFCNRIEVDFPLWRQTISSQYFYTLTHVLIIGISAFLTVGIWSHRFAGDVENINSQQVAMGSWVKEHIPPEKVIALSDIGAITYIAGRKKIIDMVGLVNPDLLAAVRSSKKDYQDVLLDFLHQRKPDYVITHPTSYPRLVAEKEVVQEIYSIELNHYSGMSAGRRMVVYKTFWNNFKEGS